MATSVRACSDQRRRGSTIPARTSTARSSPTLAQWLNFALRLIFGLFTALDLFACSSKMPSINPRSAATRVCPIWRSQPLPCVASMTPTELQISLESADSNKGNDEPAIRLQEFLRSRVLNFIDAMQAVWY